MYSFPYQTGTVGRRLLAGLTAVLLVSCSSPTVPGFGGEREHAVSASVGVPVEIPGRPEAEVVGLINEFRARSGKAPFVRHAGLDGLARRHAEEMMRRQRMSHEGFWGRSEEGTERYGLVWMAENVMWGSGYGDSELAEVIVTGWIESKGHRKNLLAPNREVGIGIVRGTDGTVWACQLSARPRS